MTTEAPIASTSAIVGGKAVPQQLVYCAVCSFPPEYCEFGAKKAKCMSWLEENHPALFAKYYSESALEDKLAHLTVDQRKALEKDLAKKEKKEEAKAEKEKAKMSSAKVVVKRMERSKKKYVTSVHGLHHFNVDMKKAAKLFANKFGAGATVSKTPQGEDEILIQGDVGDDVEEMLLERNEKKLVDVFGGKITEDQISVIIEEPKKKTAATIAAAAAALVPAQGTNH
ncbi:density-regulated protein DRP1 [Rhodotorula sp. JG-1b]|nr:density-regulated protein DRP1 [Rhodotorula sp. JG-1b]